VPHPQLSLPQQFGRFLVTGALVFALGFWGLSQILVSSHDAHLNLSAAGLMVKAGIHEPFAVWFKDFETRYLPLFLRQPPLVACYMISAAFAWLAAFLHDTKVLRKENTL
jgi:predicted benzoate:H+ symporter BenE